MKKILILVAILFSFQLAHSQIVQELIADTVKIHKRNGSAAELVLKNATKNVSGFLKNAGNGRTEFSLLTVGTDIDTFKLATRAWRQKLADSIASLGYITGAGLTTNYIPYWNGTALANSILSHGSGTVTANGHILSSSTLNRIGTVGGNDFLYAAFNSGGVIIGNHPSLSKNGVTSSGGAIMWFGTANSGVNDQVNFMTNNTARFSINSSGHLVAGTDNTYDIGASGATRPRNIYVADAGVYGGAVLGNVVYANGLFGFANQSGGNIRGYIASTTDGIFMLQNSAQNSFGRLQFGGSTSSFPSLKRSSAELQVRLADDSDYGNLAAKVIAATNSVTSARGFLLTSAASTDDNYNGFVSDAGIIPRYGSRAATNVRFIRNDANIFELTSAGIMAGTDNTYDIGASGATRFRDFYLSRNAVIGGALSATGSVVSSTDIAAGANSGVYLNGRSGITSPSDGTLTLRDWNNTGASVLNFGGNGAGNPALKRVSAALHVRTADDAGYADLVAKAFTANGAITATSGDHTFTSGSNNLWLSSTIFTADYSGGHYLQIGGNNVLVVGTSTISASKPITLETTSTPSDPSIGNMVMWFDGTNFKVKKNVGGVVTSTTLF